MDQTGRSVAKESGISPPSSKTGRDLKQNLSSEAREDYYSDVYTLDAGRTESGTKIQTQNKWPPDRIISKENVSGSGRYHFYDKIKDDPQTDDDPPGYELARDMGGNQSKSYSLFNDDEDGRRVRLISSTRNKDNRPPAKVPIVIDKNNLPPVLSNNNDIEKKPLGDENGYSCAYSKELGSPKVRLGDYTQPIDATNFTWGRNDEYCEPYVAEQLIAEASRRRQSEGNKSSNNMDVGAENSTDYNRINRNLVRPPGVQVSPSQNSTNKMTTNDGYDHTKNWTNPGGKEFVPSSGSCTYEEPWDTKLRQKELQNKLIRAQSEDMSHHSQAQGDQRRYSHDRTAARRKAAPADMYEDAWDTAERQRQLQEKLSAATRGGAGRSPTSPVAPNFESWDVKKRQMGIESRLEVAHIHDKSGPDSPTRKSPNPRSPAADTYEEAWDLNSRAKAVSYLRSNSQAEKEQPVSPHSPSPSSPTHRLVQPRPSNSTCTIGERINPIIPLQKQSWYHGRISRAIAENTLRVCKEGSYLVRESESERGQYSLSIKSSIMNIHLRISKRINGKFILGENSSDFSSIPEMIDYYTSHQVPLKGAEHLTLLHPVEKH